MSNIDDLDKISGIELISDSAAEVVSGGKRGNKRPSYLPSDQEAQYYCELKNGPNAGCEYAGNWYK